MTGVNPPVLEFSAFTPTTGLALNAAVASWPNDGTRGGSWSLSPLNAMSATSRIVYGAQHARPHVEFYGGNCFRGSGAAADMVFSGPPVAPEGVTIMFYFRWEQCQCRRP